MYITTLQLAAHNLPEQFEFYSGVLGFPALSASPEKIEFQAGATHLAFHLADPSASGPYHFAFNIPERQFAEAVQWARQRVPLIPDETGADTFYSDSWDAHNLYFYDPAGNILELIARHTLPSANHASYSAASQLGVSEIGIAADDVLGQAAAIAARAKTSVYQSASATFTAVGDENGLFIVVRRGRIWFPNTGRAALPHPLAAVTQSEAGELIWQFP